VIFNENLLFVHVPKTAGMSISAHLLELLPGPVYVTAAEPETAVGPGVVQLPGHRHERLCEVDDVVGPHGFSLKRFPLILAVIRNPYELEVSRYAYLQAGHAHDGGPAQRLAMMQDFETFASDSPYYGKRHSGIEGYFTVSGRRPEALRVVRYEQLDDDLREALASVGLASVAQLPWRNRSRHDHWRCYYTPAAEQAVYERFRWVFEQGWYPRMDTDAELPQAPGEPIHILPISGPAKQVGPCEGFSESWVLDRFDFRVLPEVAVKGLVLTGWRPPDWGEEIPLTVWLDGRRRLTEHVRGAWFRCLLELPLAAGQVAEISIASPASVRPCDAGRSEDRRPLVFKLSEIELIAADEPGAVAA
jgi:hypothetical protein